MATYKEIQDYIRSKHNKVVQTCWSADMKEHHGLNKRTASNRISIETKVNHVRKIKNIDYRSF